MGEREREEGQRRMKESDRLEENSGHAPTAINDGKKKGEFDCFEKRGC